MSKIARRRYRNSQGTLINEIGQDIILKKENCEIIQKIGKIEEIDVVGGRQFRIVVLAPVIGTG